MIGRGMAAIALAAAVLGVAPAVCAHSPAADGAERGAVAPARGQAVTLAALGLEAAPQPLVARYRVTVSPAAKNGKPAPKRQATWVFLRDDDRVALQKGAIDELWRRDAQGRIGFERVFHADERVVEYSPGELATLGVQADWRALSFFVDPAELLPLRVVARSGTGSQARIRLAGTAVGQTVTVDWLPALQLPARLHRQSRDGGTMLFELVQHGPVAHAAWSQAEARTASYIRLDAADFGDMEYEAVVRLSEALDARQGWRSAHAHD